MSHNNNDRIEQTDESGTEISQNKVRQVVCPHCGTNPPNKCREVDEDGPTGEFRDPHPERVELAAEYWNVGRFEDGDGDE